jgi:hypothetical protein
MPSPCDSPSTDPRQEFCLALKAARERKQITLSAIAASTKIPAYLFAALERGDVRRWPKGLFRRSFFRDYVRAIGLPVDETCREFVSLFPDEDAKEVAAAEPVEGKARTDDLRLALDTAWHGPRTSFLLRLFAAAMDAAIVVLAGLAIAGVTGLDSPAAVTAASLAYLIIGTALLDESPSKYLIARRGVMLEILKQGPAPVAAAWRKGGEAITYLFGDAGGGAPEPVEEPPVREWISDARRVGPAPRLRVRIKVSH